MEQQIYCSNIVIKTSLKKKMIVCLSVEVIEHYQPGILRDESSNLCWNIWRSPCDVSLLGHRFQDLWSEIINKTGRWMGFLLSYFFLFLVLIFFSIDFMFLFSRFTKCYKEVKQHIHLVLLLMLIFIHFSVQSFLAFTFVEIWK